MCQSRGVRLSPRLLQDGRYAVSEAVLDDPEYSPAHELLAEWASESVLQSDFVQAPSNEGSETLLEVDKKIMWLFGDCSSVTIPAPRVFRFELSPNSFASGNDFRNGNKRSEVVSDKNFGMGEGEAWSSFCFVPGATPTLSNVDHGIIFQWHSVDIDIPRSPILSVNIASGKLEVRTTSSSRLHGGGGSGVRNPENGVFVTHATAPAPPFGSENYIVIRSILGADGHVTAWLNGECLVDVDTPIGYYHDLQDGSGRSILGYPQSGLYTVNSGATDVVYIGNLEWGQQNLFDRVSDPLPMPEVDW